MANYYNAVPKTRKGRMVQTLVSEGFTLALSIAAISKAKDLEEARRVCRYFTPGSDGYNGPKPLCLEK